MYKYLVPQATLVDVLHNAHGMYMHHKDITTQADIYTCTVHINACMYILSYTVIVCFTAMLRS